MHRKYWRLENSGGLKFMEYSSMATSASSLVPWRVDLGSKARNKSPTGDKEWR